MRLVVAMTLLIAGPACAGQIETCKHAATLAGTIMQARQNGYSIKDIIEPILDVTPSASKQLMQKIVLGAFDLPRYSTPDNQHRAVTDYENETFLACMQS